jgi:hypothetical protein
MDSKIKNGCKVVLLAYPAILKVFKDNYSFPDGSVEQTAQQLAGKAGECHSVDEEGKHPFQFHYDGSKQIMLPLDAIESVTEEAPVIAPVLKPGEQAAATSDTSASVSVSEENKAVVAADPNIPKTVSVIVCNDEHTHLEQIFQIIPGVNGAADTKWLWKTIQTNKKK